MISMTELFERFGDDADAALAALFKSIPRNKYAVLISGWKADYRRKYAAWVRSHRTKYTVGDSPRLFDVPGAGDGIQIRDRFVVQQNGERREFGWRELSGPSGAEVLRHVIERDNRPALTTINTNKVLAKIADDMERLSKQEGRAVSFAEVVEFRRAAAS